MLLALRGIAAVTLKPDHSSSPAVGIIDLLTGILLVVLLLAAPWMLGSVSREAISWLNVGGYVLGALWFFRTILSRKLSSRLLPFLLLGAFLLAWNAVSALNAATDWTAKSTSIFPSSASAEFSWFEFNKNLALWFTFSAAASWIAGSPAHDSTRRARWLLGLLVLNGVALGGVCLAQRLAGVEKLLFTYDPPIAGLVYSWGPFYYRGNGAQYFNLLWPAALGMLLYATRKSRFSPGVVLLGIAFVFLLVLPPITASRTGLIAWGLTGLAALVAYAIRAKRPGRVLAVGMTILVAAGCTIAVVGRKSFETRKGDFEKIFQAESGRSRQNGHSRTMLADHPVMGVGPGAYEAAFRTYKFPNAWMGPDIKEDRADIKGYFFDYARAHNDWLRLLVEWGVLGFLPIMAALAVTLVNAARKSAVGVELRTGFGLGIGAYLISAWADYGLEVHSIYLTLVVYAAVLAGLNSVKATK